MSAAPNRRQFLNTVAQAYVGATFATLASAQGTPGQRRVTPSRIPVIDTHTHFYDPSRPGGVPWPPREERTLYRTVLPKDYRSLEMPNLVTGAVVVEASPWVEDNQWLLDLASKDSFIVGVVGNLPVGRPEFAGLLKRFSANRLFRGIRLRDQKLEGTLNEPTFVADLKLLAHHDLSLDLVGGGEILSYSDVLAGMFPNLRIVVDHLAGVKIDGKTPPTDWLDGMRALVPRRNVYFKLSGLVEGAGRRNEAVPRDAGFYRPTLDAMVAMFGPARLLYASNWPVSELFAPLATVQRLIEDFFRDRGLQVEEQILSLSSKAAYRWTDRGA